MGSAGLRSKVEAVADGWRTQLWPVPALGIVLGLVLGVGLPRFDAHVDSSLGAGVSSLLFGGGPSAARTLLGAIAGSLITVTSLTFSLTVLTLQLASSQYSPRLLRTFTRDRFVHLTLALFLATFTFSLAVLRSVRDATDEAAEFVPQLSVTVAFMLGIASVLGLVLFLAHLAREIRVETMLRKVHADAGETMRRTLPEAGGSPPLGSGPIPPEGALALPARESGFLARLDQDALLCAAEETEAVVRLDRPPGSSLVAGTPIGAAWPLGERFDPDTEDRLREEVGAAITTAFERTPPKTTATACASSPTSRSRPSRPASTIRPRRFTPSATSRHCCASFRDGSSGTSSCATSASESGSSSSARTSPRSSRARSPSPATTAPVTPWWWAASTQCSASWPGARPR